MIHAVHELVLSLKMYLVSAADLFIHRRCSSSSSLVTGVMASVHPPAPHALRHAEPWAAEAGGPPEAHLPTPRHRLTAGPAGRSGPLSLAREEAWQDRLNGGLGETAEQRQLPGNWGYSLRLPRQAWPPLVSARPPLSSWRVLRLSVAFLESARAFLS